MEHHKLASFRVPIIAAALLLSGPGFAGFVTAAATAALTVSTTTLPSGTVNAAYSQSLTASGGTPPYTSWAVASGTLPAGITLSSAGLLSGTPTKAGSSSFKVTVTDSAKASATASLTLTITAALTISTASTLTAGKVNVAYSQTLAATGGTPPYSGWTVSSGTLPQGLKLTSAGVLSGTPALAGSYDFAVGVSDHAGATTSASFQLTIAPGKLAITTASSLPAGQVNAVYSQSLAATGGTPPYTAWTIASGALPPGLTVNSSGLLGGAPTTAGPYSFTVQVTDSASATASASFQLTIDNPPLQIATPSPLAVGQAGATYSQTLTAIGGTPPYAKWSVTSGTLPAGLTLSSAGVLSGTPTNSGAYTFTVQVTDKTAASASATFQLTINQGALTFATTSPLPAGRVNSNYSQSLAATGGRPPYTWAANSGVPGLSFSPAGVWSGMPTSAGTFNFTIQVADSSGATLSAPFALTISPTTAVSISTTSPLPAGNVNSSYLLTLTAVNGTSPYTNWTVMSGTLPLGLALSTAGVLSGIPTNAGTCNFTVQVTDSGGISASAAFQLTINSAKLAITTTSPLPSGKVNSSYSQTLAATGGTPPYTWGSNLTTPGLTLSPAGVLSGTPTTVGTSSFTIQVTDSVAATASVLYQLTISLPALAITTQSLPVGQAGTTYSMSLAASGGTPPYTWTGSGAAPGLSVSSAGVVTGTPTAAGTFSFNAQVTDKAGATASAALPLTISAAALAITTASPLTAGKVNSSYTLSLAAGGGTPPYTNWTVSSGALPSGLTLSSAGVFTGTPTNAGTYTFTVQVADKAGATTSAPFQLTINSASLAITTPSPLPGGKVNTSYSQSFTASGGTPPYSNWTSSNGALPAGLTLSSAGLLSGTPTSAGTYSFAIQITDSANASASSPFQLTIGAGALAITTGSPLPAGRVNASYSQTLAASGGTPPYTWTSTNGAPPSGLTLNSAGLLSGTPANAGTTSFSVEVTDKAGATATTLFQLTVTSAAIAITTASSLPSGKVNTSYSQTLAASGGTPPYTWTANSGVPGLQFSPAGVWTGTPTTAGTYSFTIQVTDSSGASASASFQLIINPAALTIVTGSPLPGGNIGTAYSVSLSASGGTPSYTWTANGGVPGLQFSPAGVWTGTPTTTGTYSFTVQVTDSRGATASGVFQLIIGQAGPSVVSAVSSASTVGGLPVTTGSWVALYGTNLAPVGDSRLWNSATEIVNGKLPTSLDGTSVTVNGKAATVEYISPGQVNIQMPDDTTIGPVPVVVTTAAGGGSQPFNINYAQFSPGFFPSTAPYIVAQHGDNSYVTASAPALPGEVIVLWGAGMGPANPPVPAGQVFSGANPLANRVTVTVGGQSAPVAFAGVVGAGLVQLNVQIPTGIDSGDQAVVATVGGVSSLSGSYISVGTPTAVTSQLRAHAPGPVNLAESLDHTAVTAPVIKPATPIYAGTDNGIYKSSDGGVTWQHCLIFTGEQSSIHAVVVDPLHPDRVYAAGVNGSGAGSFFSSLDAGQTWTSVYAPPASALGLDALATNVIYLLEMQGRGIYKSEDSGETWNPTPLAEGVQAMATDPNVTGAVYAIASSAQNQLLKSYDFGMTWNPLATPVIGTISALTVDRNDSNTLYAASSANPYGVFRSTDGGNTWREFNQVHGDEPLSPLALCSVENSSGGRTPAIAIVGADPGNSNNLYFLPQWLSVTGDSNGLYRSTNSGVSWSFCPVETGRGQVLSLGIPSK